MILKKISQQQESGKNFLGGRVNANAPICTHRDLHLQEDFTYEATNFENIACFFQCGTIRVKNLLVTNTEILDFEINFYQQYYTCMHISSSQNLIGLIQSTLDTSNFKGLGKICRVISSSR